MAGRRDLRRFRNISVLVMVSLVTYGAQLVPNAIAGSIGTQNFYAYADGLGQSNCVQSSDINVQCSLSTALSEAQSSLSDSNTSADVLLETPGVNAANTALPNGDQVDASHYSGSWQITLPLGTSLEIQSDSSLSSPAILDGTGMTSSIFTIDGSGTLNLGGPTQSEGFTVENGTAPSGGGVNIVNNALVVSIDNLDFENNSAASGAGGIVGSNANNCQAGAGSPGGDGGAINNVGASLSIADSTFNGNSSGNGGTGGAGADVAHSTCIGNNPGNGGVGGAGGNGGAINDISSESFSVTNSTFMNNSAGSGGDGGVGGFALNSTPAAGGTGGNGGSGGAIYYSAQTGATASISGSTFQSNEGGAGGQGGANNSDYGTSGNGGNGGSALTFTSLDIAAGDDTVSMSSSTISQNSGGSGGSGGSAIFDGIGGSGGVGGEALSNATSLSIEFSQLSLNTGGAGGTGGAAQAYLGRSGGGGVGSAAIGNYGHLVLSSIAFTQNAGGAGGAGGQAVDGIDGASGFAGGGNDAAAPLVNRSFLAIDDSLLTSNFGGAGGAGGSALAQTGEARGGGNGGPGIIFNDASGGWARLDIANSSITANQGGVGGAGGTGSTEEGIGGPGGNGGTGAILGSGGGSDFETIVATTFSGNQVGVFGVLGTGGGINSTPGVDGSGTALSGYSNLTVFGDLFDGTCSIAGENDLGFNAQTSDAACLAPNGDDTDVTDDGVSQLTAVNGIPGMFSVPVSNPAYGIISSASTGGNITLCSSNDEQGNAATSNCSAGALDNSAVMPGVVSYEVQGGANAPAPQTYTGDSLSVESGIPTHANVTFVAWCSVPEPLLTPCPSAATLSSGDTINLTGSLTTLYATWTPDVLDYNSEGGSPTPPSQTYNDTTLTVASQIPTQSSYTFVNWCLVAESPGTYCPSDSWYASNDPITLENSTTTLYATWSPNHMVVYNAEGGTGAPASQVYVGTPLLVSTETPLFANYMFANWCSQEEPAGTSCPSGDVLTVGSTISIINRITTLYATWSPDQLFYDVGAGLGAPESQTYAGSTLQVSSVVPTLHYYAFRGWCLTSQPLGQSCPLADVEHSGSSLTLSQAQMTLYATWAIAKTPRLPDGILRESSGTTPEIAPGHFALIDEFDHLVAINGVKGLSGYYQATAEGLSLSISAALGGHTQSVHVAGSGYFPGSELRVYLCSSPTIIGTGQVLANGTYQLSITIARTAKTGDHTLQIEGVDPLGRVKSFLMGIKIPAKKKVVTHQPVATASALPTTGSPLSALVVVGLLLSALGLILLQRRTRRSKR